VRFAGGLSAARYLSVRQRWVGGADLPLEPGEQPGLAAGGVGSGIFAGPAGVCGDRRAEVALLRGEACACGHGGKTLPGSRPVAHTGTLLVRLYADGLLPGMLAQDGVQRDHLGSRAGGPGQIPGADGVHAFGAHGWPDHG
jgi:hypothetical protein